MKHPEQKEDEIFIGNFLENHFYELGWTTKRLGNKAYKRNGEIITYNTHYPVFIKRVEVEKDFTETNNKIRKQALAKLLQE